MKFVIPENFQKRLWEAFIAALVSFFTALTTTSCAGFGPFHF